MKPGASQCPHKGFAGLFPEFPRAADISVRLLDRTCTAMRKQCSRQEITGFATGIDPCRFVCLELSSLEDELGRWGTVIETTDKLAGYSAWS